MPQWLATNILGDVSNSQIHRVCLLVVKVDELGLVRRYDYRDDYSPWLEHLNAFLRMEIRNEFHIIVKCISKCSTTNHLYTSHYRCRNSGLDMYNAIQAQT